MKASMIRSGGIASKSIDDDIGTAFLVFLVFLLFEGALRKFIFPGLASAIIFVKAIPVVYIYYRAFFGRPLYLPPFATFAFIGAAASYGILGAVFPIIYYTAQHYLLTAQSYINYFLYAPLIIVMPHYVTAKLLQRILHLIVFAFAINLAVSILQFHSPKDSFLNSGVEVDGRSFAAFNAVGDTVRPPGLFAASQGNAMFMGLVFQITVGLLLSTRLRLLSDRALYSLLVGYLYFVSISGTRGLVLTTITTALLILPFVALSSQRQAMTAYGYLLAGIAAAAVLIVVAFPQGVDLLIERFQIASDVETYDTELQYGSFGRIFRSLYGFVDYLADTPPLGYLLGISSNAAKQLAWVQLPPEATDWTGYGAWASETSWADHIVDVGAPLAMLYVAFRILTAAHLLQWASTSFFQRGNAVGVSIFAGTAYLMVFGQISTNNNVGPILWASISVATCFCAASIDDKFA